MSKQNHKNKNLNKINHNLDNELYDDNIEYEISYDNSNKENPNNSITKNNYIDLLELKLNQQKQIISDLKKYKYLCEKRIKQLNPNEIFPITIQSLNEENISFNNNNDTNLNNKDIQKQYKILNDKFQNLLNDYNNIIKNNNMHDISSNTINAGNITDKYKILKQKYKKLKEENNKIIEVLKEETKACEMQKHIIDMLQQAIDNDISKNNELKKYLTIDNILDFTQLKMEAEQYRKELVLSQALVNSLKSEIENLNREKEEPNNNMEINNNYDEENYINKDNMNKFQEDPNLIISENLSLKTTLNSQAKLIKELMDENQNLKKLVDEATIKLNDVITIRHDNELGNENLNFELNTKMNEIKQYEDKFIYFNDYISIIKSIFMSFQENLPNFINIYNKMANEDLNSLLSNSFSQSIIKLNNRINQLNKIEKFNLETDIETDITKIILELLEILNSEFISIYEKVFQTNCYYKESNKKIEELKFEIRDKESTNEDNLKKINNINDLLKNEKKNLEEYKNAADDYKLKLDICHLEKENLSKKIDSYVEDKNTTVNFFYLVIKALSNYNERLSQLLRECVNIIETKSKLFTEKEIIMEQLTKNRIKDLNRNNFYKNNPEVNKIVTQEQITLQNLISEFENKINEKENQLSQNKIKIEQYLVELQNKPSDKKNNFNNNGLSSNYNYKYYLKSDNNNGKNINLKNINYNIINRNKSNNLNKRALHSFDDNIIKRNRDIKNKNSYTYTFKQENQFKNKINESNENSEIENNI